MPDSIETVDVVTDGALTYTTTYTTTGNPWPMMPDVSTPAKVVPVPQAAWLFLSALIGLVGIKPRK